MLFNSSKLFHKNIKYSEIKKSKVLKDKYRNIECQLIRFRDNKESNLSMIKDIKII